MYSIEWSKRPLRHLIGAMRTKDKDNDKKATNSKSVARDWKFLNFWQLTSKQSYWPGNKKWHWSAFVILAMFPHRFVQEFFQTFQMGEGECCRKQQGRAFKSCKWRTKLSEIMDSEKKVNDANMGRSNHLRTQKSVIDGGGNVNRIDKLLSRQILGQSVVCSGTTLWSRTQFNSFHPL